jgi:hypothetical protein
LRGKNANPRVDRRHRCCAQRAIGDLAPSAKLAGPYPVNPLGDHDLGMLAVADIAAEDTRTALPAYRLTGTPSRAKDSALADPALCSIWNPGSAAESAKRVGRR